MQNLQLLNRVISSKQNNTHQTPAYSLDYRLCSSVEWSSASNQPTNTPFQGYTVRARNVKHQNCTVSCFKSAIYTLSITIYICLFSYHVHYHVTMCNQLISQQHPWQEAPDSTVIVSTSDASGAWGINMPKKRNIHKISSHCSNTACFLE
jgi:hypothetical protein